MLVLLPLLLMLMMVDGTKRNLSWAELFVGLTATGSGTLVCNSMEIEIVKLTSIRLLCLLPLVEPPAIYTLFYIVHPFRSYECTWKDAAGMDVCSVALHWMVPSWGEEYPA